jgi:DNA-binding NarL/FixJ family response regulator
MKGGTLVACRTVIMHSHFKERFEQLGFPDVHITASDKDGLNMIIKDMKPGIFLIGSSFYKCCTPYMMAGLHRRFPKLNIAAISISEYPAELAMYFIINGVKSYVNYWEGRDEFYKGLEMVKNGEQYISPDVQKCIAKRESKLDPVKDLSEAQIEIVKLIANGYTEKEISDTLAISERTVYTHKRNIYTTVNARNEKELIRIALTLEYINQYVLNFYGRDFVLKPLPSENQKTGVKYVNKNKKRKVCVG